MAVVQLADVVIPNKFLPYMTERTAALSAFVQSGIMVRSPQMDTLVTQSGGVKTTALIAMPFWQDLSGARQVLSDTTPLTTNKILTSQDQAGKLGSGQGWSANDLVHLLIDGDPLAAVAELVASYWSRTDQTTLIQLLAGVFGASGMSGNILNIFNEDGVNANEDTEILNGDTVQDACQLLGDAKAKLTGMAIHSATETSLTKQGLIETILDANGKPTMSMYQGKRVVVDDSLPKRAGTTSGFVYTSYLFGEGAIAWGEQDLNAVAIEGGHGTYGLEMGRNAAQGDTAMYSRRIYMMHPRGVKWAPLSLAGAFPTDAELATAANWTRVWEQKNVRMVQVNHNVL